MARKKRDPDTGLPADPGAEQTADATGTAIIRFPVTGPVFTELSKYGAVRKLTQVQVAEELEADLLALFRGELKAYNPEVPGAEHTAVPSLRARALAALEKNW